MTVRNDSSALVYGGRQARSVRFEVSTTISTLRLPELGGVSSADAVSVTVTGPGCRRTRLFAPCHVSAWSMTCDVSLPLQTRWIQPWQLHSEIRPIRKISYIVSRISRPRTRVQGLEARGKAGDRAGVVGEVE